MIGAAAEITQPAFVQREVPAPGVLAAVQVLGVLLELESAALEQADPDAGSGEFARDGDAGRAGADDGEIGLDQGICRQLAGVFDPGGAVFTGRWSGPASYARMNRFRYTLRVSRPSRSGYSHVGVAGASGTSIRRPVIRL